MKKYCLFVAVGIIFCILSSVVFLNRGLTISEATTSSEFYRNASICNDMPFCFRMGGAFIGEAIVQSIRSISTPLMSNFSDANSAHYKLFISSFLYRLLMFTPILLAISVASLHGFIRLLIGMSLFLTAMGWGLARVEWPWGHDYNYYIFGMNLNFADYYSLGFVALLIYVFSKFQLNFFKFIILIIVGQLGFENLGAVCVIAGSLYWIFSDHPQKYRQALIYFGVGLVISCVLMISVYGLILSVHQGEVYWVKVGKGLDYVMEVYGKHNFDQMTYIRKAFFRMMAFPALAGVIVACLEIILKLLKCGERQESIKGFFRAAMCVWLGFLATCGVGLFVSGIRSEIGRQLLPLACLSVFLFYGLGVRLIIYCLEKIQQNKTNNA